jgi:hypothetical protein
VVRPNNSKKIRCFALTRQLSAICPKLGLEFFKGIKSKLYWFVGNFILFGLHEVDRQPIGASIFWHFKEILTALRRQINIKGDYSMKNWKQRTVIGIFAIITIAFTFIACKDDPPKDDSKVQPDTTKSLIFIAAPEYFSGPWSVTVKSDEKFTTDEWNTLVDKVVTAIEDKYIDSCGFEIVFASDQNTKVVLGNSFDYNWEVKTAEYRTIYVKTTSIGTANFAMAVAFMDAGIAHNE